MDESDEPEVRDAVVLERTISSDGRVDVTIKTTGDVRLTEVETILRLGQVHWRTRLGFD